jgi:hypothetical protein
MQPWLQVEILDEYHLIALFVVDELIDELLGQQNAKAARAHAGCLAVLDVSQPIILRIGYGSVGNLFKGKAFAGSLMRHFTI